MGFHFSFYDWGASFLKELNTITLPFPPCPPAQQSSRIQWYNGRPMRRKLHSSSEDVEKPFITGYLRWRLTNKHAGLCDSNPPTVLSLWNGGMARVANEYTFTIEGVIPGLLIQFHARSIWILLETLQDALPFYVGPLQVIPLSINSTSSSSRRVSIMSSSGSMEALSKSMIRTDPSLNTKTFSLRMSPWRTPFSWSDLYAATTLLLTPSFIFSLGSWAPYTI